MKRCEPDFFWTGGTVGDACRSICHGGEASTGYFTKSQGICISLPPLFGEVLHGTILVRP